MGARWEDGGKREPWRLRPQPLAVSRRETAPRAPPRPTSLRRRPQKPPRRDASATVHNPACGDRVTIDLTLADTNQEAANSQALSTRQSIAVSALSLANQSQASVLQLLR